MVLLKIHVCHQIANKIGFLYASIKNSSRCFSQLSPLKNAKCGKILLHRPGCEDRICKTLHHTRWQHQWYHDPGEFVAALWDDSLFDNVSRNISSASGCLSSQSRKSDRETNDTWKTNHLISCAIGASTFKKKGHPSSSFQLLRAGKVYVFTGMMRAQLDGFGSIGCGTNPLCRHASSDGKGCYTRIFEMYDHPKEAWSWCVQPLIGTRSDE